MVKFLHSAKGELNTCGLCGVPGGIIAYVDDVGI
jgi:hypothetical protein